MVGLGWGVGSGISDTTTNSSELTFTCASTGSTSRPRLRLPCLWTQKRCACPPVAFAGVPHGAIFVANRALDSTDHTHAHGEGPKMEYLCTMGPTFISYTRKLEKRERC